MIESSHGSQLDAWLKVRLARLQLEKEERERECKFQLQRELELGKLETDTSIRMRQLELQASSGRTTVGEQSSTTHVASFDVSKNVSLVPVFCESEIEAYFVYSSLAEGTVGNPAAM